VAEICARLDGMPLAIELAAARVGSLPVEAIAARLDDRFRLLTGGQRTALRRQQSLGATLDWSYGLLDPAEQLLLDRLSIFAGGWTLDAAEAVCADGVEPLGGSQGWEIPDHLDALVNKSLALLEDAGAGWDHERYRLLETVREYGAARLRARGEEVSQVRDRHLAWCVALAEAFAPRLTGQEQRRWLARLEAEHDNLRAALTWARERGGSDEGLRLAGALWRFWYLRGYLSEGWAWLSTNLAQAGGAATSAAWATAAHGASVLAWVRADYADAVQYGERALQVWRTRGHTQGMAASLNLLGLVAGDQDLWEHAEAAHTESLALREPEDYWGRATSLHNLGTAVRRRGDRERALALYGESLAIRQAHGDVAGLAIAYRDQAAMALEEGDSERAVSLYRQSLSHAADLGDILGVALCLGGLATVAAGQARAEVAAQLVGAAAALRESVGAPLTPRERGEQAQLLATLRTALGARFDDLSAAGRARHWEELVQTYVAAD
jgi:non-specific serine/threonine protein kinase